MKEIKKPKDQKSLVKINDKWYQDKTEVVRIIRYNKVTGGSMWTKEQQADLDARELKLNNKIEANAQAIMGNRKAIEANAQAIKENRKAIESNAEGIRENRKEIKAVKTTVDTILVVIKDIQTSIKDLQTSIKDIQSNLAN